MGSAVHAADQRRVVAASRGDRAPGLGRRTGVPAPTPRVTPDPGPGFHGAGAAPCALAACEAREEAPPDEPAAELRVEVVVPAGLAIGSTEGHGPDVLHGVAPPSLLPDGSVIVPVRSAGEVRIFDPAGEHVRSLGGQGDGPAEFARLSAAWPRGDTVEAWDPVLRRIMERRRMGNMTGPGPLSPSARFAFVRGEEGTRADPAEAGDRLYVAETLTPAIHVHRLSGELERSLRWTPERTWAPGEAFDRAAAATPPGREEPVRRPAGIAYPSAWVDHAAPPSQVPVFSDLMVDEEGLVWIRPYDPARDAAALGGGVGDGRAGPGGEWILLSPDGERVGSAVMPEGFEPYAIGSRTVVGIYRDELGVEFVRVHALARNGPGPGGAGALRRE